MMKQTTSLVTAITGFIMAVTVLIVAFKTKEQAKEVAWPRR